MPIDRPAPGSTSADVRHLVDLHTHSTASDGELSPAELVREANRRGVRVLGLTDHDTVAGLAEAATEAEAQGIEFVPGVELSTVHGHHETHLLGYFIERDDPDLISGLIKLANQRRERVERIVQRLSSLGIPIEMADVEEFAGTGTIGRPHVARALIKSELFASVTEAFDRYLAPGRPGYVPRTKVSPESAITLIRRAGGVAVLAHPLSTGDVGGTLARLVPAGLGGMEVFYGEYSGWVRDDLNRTAERWGLIPTGGSDFHGIGFKPGRELGGASAPVESVERLRQSADERRAVGP